MLEDKTEKPRVFGETEDMESEEDLRATPEEQQDYELLVVRSRKMMFGKGKDKILSLLGSSESPSKGIGKAGSMLIKSLMQSGEQQGRKMSADAAVNAGTEVARDLNDLGKASGVFQYDSPEEEEKELKEGVLYGVKLFGDGMIAAGEITPELQKLAKSQVTQAIEDETGDKMPDAQMKPANAAVNQAMSQPQESPQGLIGNMMQSEEQA